MENIKYIGKRNSNISKIGRGKQGILVGKSAAYPVLLVGKLSK